MIEVEKVDPFRIKKDDQVIHLTEEEARELSHQLSRYFGQSVGLPHPWTITYAEGQAVSLTDTRQHP